MKIQITHDGQFYAMITPTDHRLDGHVHRLVSEISARRLNVSLLLYDVSSHRIYNARQDLLLRATKLKIR